MNRLNSLYDEKSSWRGGPFALRSLPAITDCLMVLLHPHERSVRVRLGIAVAALAHDAKLFRVLQTLSNAEILPGTIFLYFFCFLRSKQTDTRGAAILRYPKRRTKHGQTFSHH